MRRNGDDKAARPENEGRRGFLRGAGIAGVAAVASVAATDEVQATESRQDARKARYSETDHVRRYYATNRY